MGFAPSLVDRAIEEKGKSFMDEDELYIKLWYWKFVEADKMINIIYKFSERESIPTMKIIYSYFLMTIFSEIQVKMMLSCYWRHLLDIM